MRSSLLSEDSPLRKPQLPLSRRQILILDGLRYAAEMGHVAYGRLAPLLQEIAAAGESAPVSASAEALQYSWSIVDASNRYRDLLANLPGLKAESWTRILAERTKVAADLRDCVQHQLGELDGLIANGGQIWGYVSWVLLEKNKPTPEWYMLSGGTTFSGDKFLFIGPHRLPYRVPPDRIRLNAFSRQTYLWRLVAAMAVATQELESVVRAGGIRLVGEAATGRRGADEVFSGFLEVAYSNSSAPGESAATESRVLGTADADTDDV
jgi:hypothetical protein